MTNKKTEELESYSCKISSSELQGQIEVIVPLTVAVNDFKFNKKVTLQGVTIDPYAKGSVGSSFAQVILRCSATSITTESLDKTETARNSRQK